MGIIRIIEARSGAGGAGRRIRWRGLVGSWMVVASGCANSPYTASTEEDTLRLTHRKIGYSIAQPSWVGASDWRSIDLEGADLAYGGTDGAVISLSSGCPRSRATPVVLARHVTIGTERSVIHAAGPFEVAGAEGWSQSFDSIEDGVLLHVKAVTVGAGACVYDWLLVARDPVAFESIEPVFDEWIRTFIPPPDTGQDASEGSKP
jgi:hypothetical protein